MRRILAFTLVAAACGGDKESAPAPAPAADARAPVAPPADATVVVDAAPAAEPAEPPPTPGEFDAQAKVFFRIAACGGDAPLPAHAPAAIVDAHCAALDKVIAEYREKWVDKALPFLAEIVPDDLPDQIIYPFGGTDLVTALATFPDAREITIISLEEAGDIRLVDKTKGDDLEESLKQNRDHVQFLYRSAFHRTEDLKEMTTSGLPGHLFGTFVGLKVLGYEPVTMRYFEIKEDGSLEYVTRNFTNMELTFRKPGGKLQTYRHIATNLANAPLKKNVGLKAYMTSRAPFTAMTKASSFLLWNPNFVVIRDLLLDNMVWMISDATAPLPSIAKKKGFEQIPYGTFTGAEPAFEDLKHVEEMIELWEKSEKRECPIRYGYSDIKRRPHLLITRKKATGR
jgi:hypothetical protein